MTSGIRALILEADPGDSEKILAELQAATLDVKAFRVRTPEEFRERLASSEIDLILANYAVSNVDGVSALDIAKELAPDVPFLFVSESIGEEKAVEALRDGAMDWVLKDRLSRLGPAVHRAMDRRMQGQRRRADQDQLRLTSHRFEYAAKATSDAVWDWEIARDENWIRETEAQQSGDEHDVYWWFARVHPGDRERVATDLRAAVARGDQRWNSEFRFRLGDGEHVVVSSRAFIVPDSRGVPLRVIGALQDLTEQRRSDQDFRESALRDRLVTESAADGIILTTPGSKIVYGNQRAGTMFGVPHEALVGRNFLDFLPRRSREEHTATIEMIIPGQTATAVKSMMALRADGTEFPIELSIAMAKREGDTYLTKIIRDVTGRSAEERRRQTQLQVTWLLAASPSPEESLSDLVRIMVEGLGWEGAAIWLLAPKSRRLHGAASWIRRGDDREAVTSAIEKLSFAEGEGLVGLAFRSGCAETVTLSDDDDATPHYAAAVVGGTLRATAVPIRLGGRCFGVLEFFERDGRQVDPSTLLVTEEIAGLIAHRLERARREDERLLMTERLREAQHLAHLGSWDFDIATGEAACSEETYAILGFELTDRLSFAESMNAAHPDDRSRVEQSLLSQFATGSPETLRVRYRVDRRGEEVVVDCCSRVFLNEQGVPFRAAGTLQDVTEQALASRTIAQLRKRSDLVLECAGEGIMGVDHRGRTIFSNPAACALFGWTEAELLACADTHAALHHTKQDGTPFPREECALYQTLQDGQKRSIPNDFFYRKDGQPFAVSYECAAIIEGGEIVGSVLTFRDVTESQRLNRQLDLAKRIGSLGRVAATIAHEFNNVLMGVEPFAEIIRRRAKDDEKIVRAADQISSSVRRGRRVTDEILRFTRPVDPVFKDVELRAWLTLLEPELRVLAGPTVQMELLMPGPVVAACDAAQLQQVVTNLVLNARDAMPQGGKITIILRSGAGAQAVELIVRDSGCGIPSDDLETVFEPLFTTKRGGTGLGLAVARQVVTRHQGTIEVSNLEGGGAEFRITLPFLSSSVESKGREEALKPVVSGEYRRLLLVEDEEAIAMGLSALLESEGFLVRWVASGEAVVGAVETFDPHAIILDLTLPDIDGDVVFDLLRKRWPLLPVVFSTGHGGEGDLAEQLGQRHVGLLQKPYAIAALIAAVDRAVAA
jgi:two-component system cell cycle sensor histidine kinase/response regulator CckA